MKKKFITVCLIIFIVNCFGVAVSAEIVDYYDVVAELCGGTPKLYTDRDFTPSEIEHFYESGEEDWWKNFPECDGIYHYAQVDMDKDGIEELIVSYAKAEFSDAYGDIEPIGTLYIYTMSNGKPLKILEWSTEWGNIVGYNGGWRLGISKTSDRNYVIVSDFGTEGASAIDYYVFYKDGNSIKSACTLYSYSDIGYDNIEYSFDKDNYKRMVSEKEFKTEAEKYMKYIGKGILGEGYGDQIAFAPDENIVQLNDLSVLNELKNINISILLNGKELAFEQSPVIENGTTLVPMRTIFEAMGASVEWDGTTQTVTSVKDDKTISLTLNKETAMVNGESISLAVPAKLINGNTMVPLRFVSESLGAEVNWDGGSKTITIKG